MAVVTTALLPWYLGFIAYRMTKAKLLAESEYYTFREGDDGEA